MTKPMVERYEQLLAQDPTSTVFVELAKAYIERGEHDRAIDVCKGGLSHHRDSVVGRVLWGKALINLGRPAEAMEQFDQAIVIDKDNPHAYNLIGEVLLHKGLYRSALPLLRKAVALQPNDHRVRQWLEQTQRVLSGGPAPVIADLTVVDSRPGPSAELGLSEPTELIRVPAELMAQAAEAGARARASGLNGGPPVLTPVSDPASQAPQDPFDAVTAGRDQEEIIAGMTSTFDALVHPSPNEGDGLWPTGAEPTVVPSADLLQEAGAPPQAKGSVALLGDLPDLPTERGPTRAAPARPAPRPAERGGGLLSDIPDAPEPTSSYDLPKVELSNTAAEAIAKEYERELRDKLAQQASRRSFLQRHGGKLAFVVVLLVAAASGVAFFRYTRTRNQGRDLKTTLADAQRAFFQDTALSLKEAQELLGHGARMDEGNEQVWALTAYANAMLAGEHGGGEAERAAASNALAKPGLRDAYPDLVLLVEYFLSSPEERAARRKDVLEAAQAQSSSADELTSSMLQTLAGRLLFEAGQQKPALDRLDRALKLAPENVRALVLLGDYYREAGDFRNALNSYGGNTATLSPKHPQRALGAAESRLALSQELTEALAEVRALPPAVLTPALMPRRDRVLGRLLSVNGEHAEALELLGRAVSQHPSEAYELKLALGEAQRDAGQLGAATKSLEEALKLKETVEVKAALARVLIARDRTQEVLSRIPASSDRTLSLVRGIAAAKRGDWRLTRRELAKTQLGGKFPSEAVVYLALADAADGQLERAQGVLEKVLAATKLQRAEVRVALGEVYLQRGALDKARTQFEEAAKEPHGFEAACALGRLLLSLDLPEAAVAPLSQAVTRNNAHGEALHALVGALLATGRREEAVRQARLFVDEVGSTEAMTDLAAALYQSGELKEAAAVSARAVRAKGQDVRTLRQRAKILFARNEVKGAFSMLERANKLDPKDGDTFCEIGHAFIRQGAVENGFAAFSAAVREEPKSVCGAVGQLYARLPSGGKASVRKLADLSKRSTDVWDKAFAESTLARVYLSLRNVKEARKVADEAVQLAPAQGRAQLALGLVAARQNDEATAQAALVRALELEPAFGAVHLAYGDLLARGAAEELPRAVAAYERYLELGGGNEEARVKRVLATLKKKLAAR